MGKLTKITPREAWLEGGRGRRQRAGPARKPSDRRDRRSRRGLARAPAEPSRPRRAAPAADRLLLRQRSRRARRRRADRVSSAVVGAGVPLRAPALGGDLDQGACLLDRDLLTVNRLRMELGHPHDLIFIATADLEAAGAAKAFQLAHWRSW